MFVFQKASLIFIFFCLRCEALYEQYKLYRVNCRTQDHLVNLINYKTLYSKNYDIWNTRLSTYNSVLILSSPEAAANLTQFINSNNMTYDVVMDDLHSVIEQEKTLNRFQRTTSRRKRTRMRNHAYYKSYDEIQLYLQDTARMYSFVTLETLGVTVEGRNISGLLISTDPTKPIIWIDAGIHAREWIAPATALYLIDRLVMNSGKPLLQNYQFYIVPLVNPDGYVYSHEKDRLWRGNRKVQPPHRCVGVDLNRNFPFYWGGTGSTDNECEEIYRGPEAASELETQSLMKKLSQLREKMLLYLTLHSFGQYIIVPFGFSRKYAPASQGKMFRVANLVRDAIKNEHGFRYTVGTAPTVLYEATGASDDYAAGALNIKYAYTIELLDTGVYGFTLPPAYIRPTGRQMWTALKEFARNLENET